MKEDLTPKNIEKPDFGDSAEFPIMPLRNTVLFPQQVIPIYIGREKSLHLIGDLDKGTKKYIVVVAQEDGSIEDPGKED